MKYVSIDIETTGLDSELHQILEVGAIIEDTEFPLSYDEIPKFSCILEHENYTGNPYAINMNQRIFKILAGIPRNFGESEAYKVEHNILTENKFVTDFFNWLNEFYDLNIPYTQRVYPIVAGKNFRGFDQQFLSKIHNFDNLIKIHHRVLDPSMLFTDMKNDKNPASLDICISRAGLKGMVTHEALQDAWDVIRVLRTKY